MAWCADAHSAGAWLPPFGVTAPALWSSEHRSGSVRAAASLVPMSEDPRPRAGETRRGDTKQRILDAAEELWADQGFETVTVADICARAGVTQAAFFYHHRSIPSLLVTLLRSRIFVRSLLETIAVSAATTTEIVDTLVESAWSAVSSYEPALLSAMVKASMFDPDLWGEYDGLSNVADLVLRRGMARGEIRDDIPLAEISRITVAICLGVLVEFAMDVVSPEDTRRVLATRLQIMVESMAPR